MKESQHKDKPAGTPGAGKAPDARAAHGYRNEVSWDAGEGRQDGGLPHLSPSDAGGSVPGSGLRRHRCPIFQINSLDGALYGVRVVKPQRMGL